MEHDMRLYRRYRYIFYIMRPSPKDRHLVQDKTIVIDRGDDRGKRNTVEERCPAACP